MACPQMLKVVFISIQARPARRPPKSAVIIGKKARQTYGKSSSGTLTVMARLSRLQMQSTSAVVMAMRKTTDMQSLSTLQVALVLGAGFWEERAGEAQKR